MKAMRAVILAGGKGTRLRPLTYAVPKPLLPINQKPILEHIILHMKKHGIKDFIITIAHLGYQIKNYFGDGSEFGVNIEYSEEKKPLGNAGCLLPIKEKLKETFLLVGGDNLTTMDFSKFIRFHKKTGGIATLALIEISIPVEYGIAKLNKKSQIVKFKEKPTFTYPAATCIWALEPAIFKYIPRGFSDINKDILPKMLKAGVKVYGWPFKEFWIDVGEVEQYQKMNGKLKI